MLVKSSYEPISLGLWIRTLNSATPASTKEWATEAFKKMHALLLSNDLRVSLAYTNGDKYGDTIKSLNGLQSDNAPIGALIASKISERMQALEQVVFAESATKKIYILPDRRFNTEYLLNNPSKLLKDGAFEKLDEIAQHDINGACKCLLFGQSTAAAFHILRATESVLKSYYFHHRKKDRLKKPMWADMVSQLQAKKVGKPSLGLLKSLDNIRQTYRNPTQHPEAIYDIDRVQDLFGVCLDVIGQMADEL